MTLLKLRKHATVINTDQIKRLKGGSDGSDTATIIIVEDVDAL